VLLRTGIGYVSNEENHELLSGTVDTIAIDSIYSPVRTANFTVEPVRIKQKADYERLIIEITHFPTTRARDALKEALNIVDRHAQQLLACLTTQGSMDSASEATTLNEDVMSKGLETVDGVKTRWAKVLKVAGIETVADYLEHRGESVSDFGEAGRRSVDEALRDFGISVSED
jgi:DNA-directed RNA polymerase subunit alpha